MTRVSCLLLVLAAACGGVVDDPNGVEAALGKKDGGCSDVSAGPACTAPKKYALLFKGRPKPTGFSNDQSGEDEGDMDDNITQMSAALTARGYEVSSVDNYSAFDAAVTRLAKKIRCCDELLFYYTGHGSHKKGNPKTDFGYLDAQGEMHFLVVDSQTSTPGRVMPAKNLDARALALELSKLKTCHLHVVIDACYSGGFVDALMSTLPGLESMQTSASSTEKAWGGGIDSAQALNDDGTPANPPHVVQDPYGRAQGEKGSEFSSGFSVGINDAPAGSDTEDLMQAAFGAAIARDVTALAHWTHPVNRRRSGGCICDGRGDPWIPVCAPLPSTEPRTQSPPDLSLTETRGE